MDKTATVADITCEIEKIAPPGLQESWDNSGLLIGFGKRPVKRILTSLEISEAVVREACELKAEMIVTHHPVIFSPLRNITDDDPDSRSVMCLITEQISVYSSHTPFDKVKGGNNDILASMLGLENVMTLNMQVVPDAEEMIRNESFADIGRIGDLRTPAYAIRMIDMVSERLDIDKAMLRYTGDPHRMIRRIAICSGAGADLMKAAAEAGADLFITGDVKYHEARYAADRGICILDAGHYGTEKIFAHEMKKKLEKILGKDPGIEIIESEVDLDPFSVF